jgi:Zn-dependent protease
MSFDPLELAIRVPVLLLALTLHEFAHAYSAYRLGDPTAYRLGRCSLNPLVHLDPIGAICLLVAPIGWAKPVPVNPLNLKNPGRDDIIISAAGPLSNLAQALVFALALRVVMSFGPPFYVAFHERGAWAAAILFVAFGILLNVGLAVFNMIPAFPLDGFHVVSNLAKGESRRRMLEMAPFGPYIILGIVLVSWFSGLNLILRAIYPFARFFMVTVGGSPEILGLFFRA